MSEELKDPAAERWHADKRIPVALLTAIVMQTVTVAWWASGVTSRVTAIEVAISGLPAMQTSITQMETKIQAFTAVGRRWSREQQEAFAGVQEQLHSAHVRRMEAIKEEVGRLKEDARALREEFRQIYRRLLALEADKS